MTSCTSVRNRRGKGDNSAQPMWSPSTSHRGSEVAVNSVYSWLVQQELRGWVMQIFCWLLTRHCWTMTSSRSAHLSVPSIDSSSGVRRVFCWARASRGTCYFCAVAWHHQDPIAIRILPRIRRAISQQQHSDVHHLIAADPQLKDRMDRARQKHARQYSGNLAQGKESIFEAAAARRANSISSEGFSQLRYSPLMLRSHPTANYNKAVIDRRPSRCCHLESCF